MQRNMDEPESSKLGGVAVTSYGSEEGEPLLPSRSSRSRFVKFIGGAGTAVCIVTIVVSWVTMADKLQALGNKYQKPFFQTYFIHSHYAVLYIMWKLWLVFPGNFSCNRAGEGRLTNFKWLAISTGVLAAIIFASGYLWYLSLTRTSLSANTAVYQSASAVVFVISVPVLRERVTLLKIFSVLLTVGGVSMVSIFSQDRNPAHINGTLPNLINSTFPSVGVAGGVARNDTAEKTTPLGFVYLVTSTILYAVGEVGFKKFATKPDDPATIQNGVRGLGYMGVHTLLWSWPLLILMHYTGLETFQWPSLYVMKMLFLNAMLDVLFNVGLYVCIALSSPLVATVGSVLVVPASVLVDWMVHDKFLDWEAYFGIALIICGFFALVFSESWKFFFWERRQRLGAHSQRRLDLAEGLSTANAKKRRPIFYYII